MSFLINILFLIIFTVGEGQFASTQSASSLSASSKTVAAINFFELDKKHLKEVNSLSLNSYLDDNY